MAVPYKVKKRLNCSICGRSFADGETVIQEAEKVNGNYTGNLMHYCPDGCQIGLFHE